jgi:hypothetical protein
MAWGIDPVGAPPRRHVRSGLAAEQSREVRLAGRAEFQCDIREPRAGESDQILHSRDLAANDLGKWRTELLPVPRTLSLS